MSVPSSRPDHAREIRSSLVDAAHLCERLGLLGGRGTFMRQAGGVIVRCPVHEERTPSCSVRRGPDGTVAWKCHGCEATGDALTLIAAVHGLSTKSDFRQVLRAGAEMAGLWQIVDEIDTRTTQRERPVLPPRAAPEPERTYPPTSDVDTVWGSARPVTEDLEASAWIVGRGLDPEVVASDDLARVIPKEATLPRWAAYRRASWTQTGHRLIVPMRDPHGTIRSVRGCRVVDGESPKRLPPGGYKATGLVMACAMGVAMLAGTIAPREVVIAEGEPDFLTFATRRTSAPTARLGIVSGSWSFAMAERCPPGCQVWIWTDADTAGERYANELQRTLRWRGCFVHRGDVRG